MSNVRPTIVSQLPLLEISWPKKNSRKLRQASDENVRLPHDGRGPSLSGEISSDDECRRAVLL
jgi:hypothetical protein